MPFGIESAEIEKSTLTLDFFGTPKLVLKKKNAYAYLHNKNLKVTYSFDEKYNMLKPLGLSATVFAFYLLAIGYSRISLSFAEARKLKQVKLA